jgi:ADP-dependent NAD(P)H-hydrate dehydratase / NAD(P)H-hydrate epimerase
MTKEGRVRPAGASDVYGCANVPLPTAAEATAADRAARETHAVPERVLMENAGRAAALVLAAGHPAARITVLIGSGNNGGDGCVVARLLHEWGRDVTLVPAAQPPRADLLNGLELRTLSGDDARAAIAGADILVDALLGTGARGAPRSAYAALIDAANASGRPILALDLPSGVDATTGEAYSPAVAASATVCFGWPKLGLLLQPARRHCGRLVAVEIGFPPQVARAFGAAAITPAWAAARLPARPAGAHKGTAGRLLLLAGGEAMGGAAIIAAKAALAAGAGLVRVVAHETNRGALHAAVPEAIVARFDDDTAGDAHAVAAGPGLGTGDDARLALGRVLDATGDRPVALDADALNIFAREPDALAALAASRPLVLTPHPGELGRLLDRPTDEVAREPVAAALAAANRFGCTVLLKGQPSIVAQAGEPLLVNTSGSSDLASAGMGDHLTGVIGALLAAGASPSDAAGVALYYSGRGADLAGYGRSLTPSVATRWLRRALRQPLALRPHGLPFITFDQPARW